MTPGAMRIARRQASLAWNHPGAERFANGPFRGAGTDR